MPVTIGAKIDSDFSDPLGMLSDCHRRIERFLQALAAVVAEAKGGALSAEQRRALENSLRYFREAAPKHTADEEESLFPVLRRSGGSDAEPLLKQVDALEKDHDFASNTHAEVERLGQKWLADGSLSAQEIDALSGHVASLVELYRQHIECEDSIVFPAAAKILSDADRARIGIEMAARRSVRIHSSPAGL